MGFRLITDKNLPAEMKIPSCFECSSPDQMDTARMAKQHFPTEVIGNDFNIISHRIPIINKFFTEFG